MKITTKQLKQLIREQVEEMAGANRSRALEQVLDSIRALSDDDFEAFEKAVLSPAGEVNPELRPAEYLDRALKSRNWKRINREISDADLHVMGRGAGETLAALARGDRVSRKEEAALIGALNRFGYRNIG
jgi:hypothetical protein